MSSLEQNLQSYFLKDLKALEAGPTDKLSSSKILNSEEQDQAINLLNQALTDDRTISEIITELEANGILIDGFWSSAVIKDGEIKNLTLRQVHALRSSQKYSGENSINFVSSWNIDGRYDDLVEQVGAIHNHKFVNNPDLVKQQLEKGVNKIDLLKPELLTQEMAVSLLKIDEKAFEYMDLTSYKYDHIDAASLEWIPWIGGYHEGLETEFIVSDLDSFMENNSANLSDKSFVLTTKNPFSTRNSSTTVLFNSNFTTPNISSHTSSPRYTPGEMMQSATQVGSTSSYVSTINMTTEISNDDKEGMASRVKSEFLAHRIPTNFLQSEAEVDQVLNTYFKYDAQYTLIHELTHVSDYNLSIYSQSVQKGEAQSDIVAALYLINHTLEQGEGEDYIKGLIVARFSQVIYGSQGYELVGDVDHATSPPLIKLLVLYQDNPEQFTGLSHLQMTDIAKKMINSSSEDFIQKQELESSLETKTGDVIIKAYLEKSLNNAKEYATKGNSVLSKAQPATQNLKQTLLASKSPATSKIGIGTGKPNNKIT